MKCCFGLFARWEYRPLSSILVCLWPFFPFLSRCIPYFFFRFLCLSAMCLSAFLFFSFLVSACHVILVSGFLSVCIYLHFLFFISFSTGSCLVLSHSVVLHTFSDHFRYKILRRHLLMKFCIRFSVFFLCNSPCLRAV